MNDQLLASSFWKPFTDNMKQPRPNQSSYPNYLPNGQVPTPIPAPGATPLLPNQGRVLQTGPVRVLCVADVRGKAPLRNSSEKYTYNNSGNLKSLNDLAKQANAHHIIHTGDFGFYDETSLERIAEK
jgi:hypothetical protein